MKSSMIFNKHIVSCMHNYGITEKSFTTLKNACASHLTLPLSLGKLPK